MAQLRQDHHRFQEHDTVVLVIGPDKADAFRDYWEKEDLPFIGLPDPQHTVLKRYGQEVNLFKLGRMPAQMLVDREGVLRYVYYGHDMSDIPSNAEMIALIEGLD